KGIEVLHDISSTDARKTKLTAERMSRRSSTDVVLLGDADMYQVAQLGVFDTLTPDKVPNLDNAIARLRRDYAVPHILSGQVILYNPDKIRTPPRTMKDLWNPDYRGRVGL